MWPTRVPPARPRPPAWQNRAGRARARRRARGRDGARLALRNGVADVGAYARPQRAAQAGVLLGAQRRQRDIAKAVAVADSAFVQPCSPRWRMCNRA